jgi:hypothetical protein
MLRIDLDAAGVPYAVEGPDGPLYADFHAFRHSYIALLDKSGATLKEAMQLARHSDPKLTMAVYGRAQLHDLGRAVERLPLLSGPAGVTPAQTGTEDMATPPYTTLTLIPDGKCRGVMTSEGERTDGCETQDGRNPLTLQEVAAGCGPMSAADSSSPTRTRTWNKPINSRVGRGRQKVPNPIADSSLPRSIPVCKRVRSLARTCEKMPDFCIPRCGMQKNAEPATNRGDRSSSAHRRCR